MTIHENRTAAADYTCSICGGRISKGTNHVRTRGRSNGARTSVRSHLTCAVPVHVRVTQPWGLNTVVAPAIGSSEYADLMRRAGISNQGLTGHPHAIPTRPVQKHFSEAGEKKGGIGEFISPGAVVVAGAAILVLMACIVAVVDFLASYGGGQ